MMTVEKLITDHIDIWSSALQTRCTAGRGSNGKIDLYGIKKLRELILELAVRGKLVPQDPKDEPASELLKRIAAEKADLVKQGKIKKQKPLPEISEDEKPFELPVGWEWQRLIELGSWAIGSGFPTSIQGITSEDILMCKVSDMNLQGNEKYIKATNNTISEESAIQRKINVSEPGTVIFPKIGGAIATNKRRILVKKTAIDNNCLGIRPFEQINLEWFFLILNAIDMAKYQSGTSVPAINQSVIGNIVIALPSEYMQARIVAKVEELMSLCDQLEQQSLTSLDAHQQLVETLLATLTDSQNADELAENWARISLHFDTLFTTEASIDALKQTILQLAVMGLLIESAEFSQLDHLKKHLSFGPKNGLSPSEVKYETDIKVLKLGATSYGYLKLQETKYVDIDVSDKLHLFLKKNDILIQRGNSSNFVGCSLLIEEDFDNLIYPDLMMKIKTKDELLPEYARLWLSSPFARNYMWSKMTGTSGTMPKISKKVVEDLPIAVPPLAVQHQLVIKIKELFLLCGSLKSRLQSAQQNQLHLADALTNAALN
jgi:type I restriction enzyme S subunit